MRGTLIFDRSCLKVPRTLIGVRIVRDVLAIAALAVVIGGVPAYADPSSVQYEGSHAVWKIGEMPVWRFPKASSAIVTTMSERFNVLYRKGFSLRDLRVAKVGGEWSLCIGGNILGSALPEHCVEGKRNAKTVALLWMSRLYDAIGDLHAQDLTTKYKLKGGFDITSSVSWYGGKFIGRKFANGERFTEGHLTAAAKSLPFGTLVKLTTPSTGRTVVVRVTDRFGEHKGRALDISQAAAEVLGIKGAGVAKVQIQVIGRVDRVGGR